MAHAPELGSHRSAQANSKFIKLIEFLSSGRVEGKKKHAKANDNTFQGSADNIVVTLLESSVADACRPEA